MMNEIRGTATDYRIDLEIRGRVDSNNAAETEEKIREIVAGHTGQPIVVDVEDMEYISSAGLRVILKIKKQHPEMRIVNANPEVYEIFDMTGFTQMMNVERAYKRISIDGCEVIGQGANGTVYRIDDDNVVKVYNDTDALDEIQNEREVARLALVLGIPTAISYDVVRVGDSYGSVFELLDATSFSKILANKPDRFDWCVEEYVKLLKKIHSTEVPAGKLSSMKETALDWAVFMKDHLPEEAGDKLVRLVEAVPEDDHMLHGDYHTKNVMLTGDEVLLIDMDTLAVGHPVFELASMFNAFVGFSEIDNEVVKRFQGFDLELSSKFWRRTLSEYLGTDDEDTVRDVENKARVVGYTRLIRRLIRRKGLETAEGRAEIDWWRDELIQLLREVDDLTFDNHLSDETASAESFEIKVPAKKSELPGVIEFLEEKMQNAGCNMKTQIKMDVAVEEIFTNIAQYAYSPGEGDAEIKLDIFEDPDAIQVTFKDRGIPYNPLSKDDPDVSLSAEERQIGGLGIYMVKQSMDDMKYEYRDGYNILKIKSLLKGGKDEQ